MICFCCLHIYVSIVAAIIWQFSDWILKICIASTLVYVFWYKRPKYAPPGPIGVPVFGYVSIFFDRIEKVAYNLSKKYGPIISVRIGSYDMVFLNDYSTVHQAYIQNGAALSGRLPVSSFATSKNNSGLIFIDYGEKFFHQRKFGLRTLRGLRNDAKGFEKICIDELTCLTQIVLNKRNVACNVAPIFHQAVGNVICSLLFGKRFDYDDEEYHELLYLVTKVLQSSDLALVDTLTAFAPSLKYIPPFYFAHIKMKKSVQTILDRLKIIVKQHEETFDENHLRSFIDAFILEKRKMKHPSFTDLQLVHYIHDLFLAGTETTSSTLCWALLCLLHYPKIQNKLREEIFNVFGPSGNISISKKSETPYTNAFILELFRFRPIVPLSIAHKAIVDTKIGDYVIRKDTRVFSNIWAVHNDPNFFKNPEQFNPERFLDEKRNFVNSKQVIPFSLGPRHCLGEQLARVELYVFLVGLVQKFEFLPDPSTGKLPSLNDTKRSLLCISKDYKLVLKSL